ncbi:hypothetical protein MMC12_003488 [Toensbergia leucococca]|nr:hypothetical protein [Toensbergia leucococca]
MPPKTLESEYNAWVEAWSEDKAPTQEEFDHFFDSVLMEGRYQPVEETTAAGEVPAQGTGAPPPRRRGRPPKGEERTRNRSEAGKRPPKGEEGTKRKSEAAKKGWQRLKDIREGKIPPLPKGATRHGETEAEREKWEEGREDRFRKGLIKRKETYESTREARDAEKQKRDEKRENERKTKEEFTKQVWEREEAARQFNETLLASQTSQLSMAPSQSGFFSRDEGGQGRGGGTVDQHDKSRNLKRP